MGYRDIEYSKGYSAKYYATFVDVGTWSDRGRVQITGGSINRSTDDLMESADLDCVRYFETSERLIRVWLDISQNGIVGHTPLFTGWASSPERNINGNLETNTVQCYSVLKPAQDILLPPGWYAPLSTDSKELIKELLKPTKAPIIFSDKATPPPLKNVLIAEEDENNLSMAELIIYAIGWRLQILGDGRLFLSPVDKKNPEIVASYDYLHNDILEKSIKVTYDWYECPNVFRAIVDGSYSIAKDEDPNSIFSIPSRGREIWAQESNCDLNENESPAEYAARRLEELQQVNTIVSYDRRYIPNVYPSDCVRINYPAQDLRGRYQIISQSIDLGYNSRTSEEVVQIGEYA